MPSRTRNSMKVSGKRDRRKSIPEKKSLDKPASKKNPEAVAATKKKTPAKKRVTSPEDAILASAAVDPDLEKAAKPKKATKKKTAPTKAKAAPSKTARTRKTAPKKAKTKKTKA